LVTALGWTCELLTDRANQWAALRILAFQAHKNSAPCLLAG
jgi:hypothetical protein